MTDEAWGADEESWNMRVRFQGPGFGVVSTFSQAYLYPSCIPRPPVYTLIFPRSPACFSSLRSLEASQQANTRILRRHRIEKYPFKSRPYLDVNNSVAL